MKQFNKDQLIPEYHDFIGESLHTKVLYTVDMAYCLGKVKARINRLYYGMFVVKLERLGFTQTTFIPNSHSVFCNDAGNKIKVVMQ